MLEMWVVQVLKPYDVFERVMRMVLPCHVMILRSVLILGHRYTCDKGVDVVP